MTLLPDMPGMAREIVHGRDPYAGYQRGAGIKFTDLPYKILQEPDFQEAFEIAEGRSVCGKARLMNLYLLIRYFLPELAPGHIVEFGSYRGGSAMFMAKLCQRHLPKTRVFALDTFEGMPETDKTIDAHFAGDFNDASFDEIEQTRARLGLGNLTLVKGLFEHTTPDVVAQGPIALAHIDCDIYHPAIYAWDQVAPAMVPGGYVVFDDATEAACLGATQAVEEIVHRHNLRSEQVEPHFVFRYPPL